MRNNSLGTANLIFIILCTWYTASIAQDTFPPSLSTTIDHYAQEWIEPTTSLCPSALQVLANFIYFSYRYCYLDMQTNRALIELKTTLPALQTEIRAHENPLPKSIAYVLASKKFFAFNGLRFYTYRCWQNCTSYLESLNDPLLNKMYEQLQSQGQNIIAEYFATNTTIPICLTHLKKNLKQTNQHFNYLINKINFMFDTTTNHIPLPDPVMDVENAFQINKEIQTILEELYQPLVALDRYESTILLVAAKVFRAYYCVLHPNLPMQYQRILFGPYGLLSEQQQYVLPTPATLLL
jgi:hypothetical protein